MAASNSLRRIAKPLGLVVVPALVVGTYREARIQRSARRLGLPDRPGLLAPLAKPFTKP